MLCNFREKFLTLIATKIKHILRFEKNNGTAAKKYYA
jgi:hypothetical protein